METTGTVISTSKQWWLKVNVKPLRMGTMDGATFPYIVEIKYMVNGKEYIKRQWIGAGKHVPSVGSSINLIYDIERPSKAKVVE